MTFFFAHSHAQVATVNMVKRSSAEALRLRSRKGMRRGNDMVLKYPHAHPERGGRVTYPGSGSGRLTDTMMVFAALAWA